MFYYINTEDMNGDGAGFRNKKEAERILDTLNEQYETTYVMIEVEELTTIELRRGEILSLME